MPISDTLAEIESALATVQRTLDHLTSRGDDEAAFEVARAQYAASIRASWPGNLGALLQVLERVAQDTKLKLTPQERADVGRAAGALRRAVDQ